MGGREIERTMVTQKMQGFLDRFRPPLKDNSSTSCILVLLMAIDVVVDLTPVGWIYPSFCIKGARL
jgi:hypothetical protein